jgi:hypothetical protein
MTFSKSDWKSPEISGNLGSSHWIQRHVGDLSFFAFFCFQQMSLNVAEAHGFYCKVFARNRFNPV